MNGLVVNILDTDLDMWVPWQVWFVTIVFLYKSYRVVADKNFWALPKILDKNCFHQIFNLIMIGAFKNKIIFVFLKVSITSHGEIKEIVFT